MKILTVLLMSMASLTPGVLSEWIKTTEKGCPSLCVCYVDNNQTSWMKTDCRKQTYWLPPSDISTNTTHLDLLGNNIVGVSVEYFRPYKDLLEMDLARNKIDFIRPGNFRHLKKLETLDLSENNLDFLEDGAFDGLASLVSLYLNENNISQVEDRSFQDLYNLQHLWMHVNRIEDLPRRLLWGQRKLKVLSLNTNNMKKIDGYLFRDAISLEFLFLQFNEALVNISDYAFTNASSLRYLFMDDTNFTLFNEKTFVGAKSLEIVSLSNNAFFEHLYKYTFGTRNTPSLKIVHLLDTKLVQIHMGSFNGHRAVGMVISPLQETIPVYAGDDKRLEYGLGRNGYICNGSKCVPCGYGYYQEREDEKYICKPCPAGGFFQNTVGHYGKHAGLTGCKFCPHGTYVQHGKTPAIVRRTCAVCPAGTNTAEWANYRACYCIKDFYRRDRYGSCRTCDLSKEGEQKKLIPGVLCNETQLVREGYWWQFSSYNQSWRYQLFLDSLMEPYNNYDLRYRRFTGEFPKAYPCPRATSCLGLLHSVRKPCVTGYSGPLCEVCERNYHKSMNRCIKCPTMPWLIGQVTAVSVVLMVIILVLMRDERKTEKRNKRTVADVMLARLKIVISFYQVTAGTLEAFSYVDWPDALLQISDYAKFAQLNVVQIAPMHCFTHDIKMNAYQGLFMSVGINLGVVIGSIVYYIIKKGLILRFSKKSQEEKKDDLHYCKSNCYRSSFLVLFVTFPDVCSRILGVLPQSCAQLCVDREEKNCKLYLKDDYTLNCYDESHNKVVKFAYVASIYSLAFPLFIFVVLYFRYYRKHVKPVATSPTSRLKQLAVVDGLKFVYENYSKECWYWEIVEMVRKLTLTSGLKLIGSEGRSYVGMAAMGSGFYAVAFAHAHPSPDSFEHHLQLASLVSTFFNLSIGVLLRIPRIMKDYTIQEDKNDSVGVTLILIVANVSVTALLVVRYVISFGQSIIAAIRYPRCSWECCIGVFLSVEGTGPGFKELDAGDNANGSRIDMNENISNMDQHYLSFENEGMDDDRIRCEPASGDECPSYEDVYGPVTQNMARTGDKYVVDVIEGDKVPDGADESVTLGRGKHMTTQF